MFAATGTLIEVGGKNLEERKLPCHHYCDPDPDFQL